MPIRIITVVLLLCLRVSAIGQSVPAMVGPEDFSILPWSWIPGDAEVLRGIRDCGFNLAGFVSPDSLDAVKAAGLKGIVTGLHVTNPDHVDAAAIHKEVAELIVRVGDHPAAYGYYLRDEPNANLFPALAAYAAALREVAPDAHPYINLFPNYASETQLGTPTYEEYLKRFITTVKPPFVSYDHYALMEGGVLRGGYFENLEAVRKAAFEYDLPFWNIVLSEAHFDFAEPTEAGFRFQAYTTLAYGARGISYFTYTARNLTNCRLAPIDQFGERTPTWDMLRRVNLQIHALAPTLIKLKSVNVFHHGDVPEGGKGLNESKYVAELAGNHLMVGEFEGPDGKPYIMVVNKDLHRSTVCRVRFNKPGRIMETNSYTGRAHPWYGQDSWLAPGQGILLSLE